MPAGKRRVSLPPPLFSPLQRSGEPGGLPFRNNMKPGTRPEGVGTESPAGCEEMTKASTRMSSSQAAGHSEKTLPPFFSYIPIFRTAVTVSHKEPNIILALLSDNPVHSSKLNKGKSSSTSDNSSSRPTTSMTLSIFSWPNRFAQSLNFLEQSSKVIGLSRLPRGCSTTFE
jgi:hypothetical protein